MISNVFLLLLFCMIMVYITLLFYFRQGLFRLKLPDSKFQPNVSIIVPAHNEEKTLPILLNALQEQNYPAEKMEIILVDDRSTDQTNKQMCQFATKHSNVQVLTLTQCSNNTAPKKRAIQQGIEKAKGDIILTTDADSSPTPLWVSTMMQFYSNKTVMLLGYAPYTIEPPYHTLFHKMLALDYFAMGAIGAASVGMGYPSTSNGANFSYRKKTFKRAGGFGETTQWISGDDDLLMHRFHEKSLGQIGYAFDSDAAVFNLPPKNFKHFFFQRVRFASKHLAYPPKMIGVLSFIYLLNLLTLILFICATVSSKLASGFIVIFLVKALGEIIFLLPAQKKLEKRNLLKYYPLTAIPHLLYVTIFPLLGQILQPRWSASKE